MPLIQDGKPVRKELTALGFTPEGGQTQTGAGNTPKGEFTVDPESTESVFHFPIGLDFPAPKTSSRWPEAAGQPVATSSSMASRTPCPPG